MSSWSSPRRWPRGLLKWDKADQEWDQAQVDPVDLVQVAAALAVLVVPLVPVQVAAADPENGQGVLESVVDLLVTANGPLGHPLMMPPQVVMVQPRFSVRYDLADLPHPIKSTGRVRIFSFFKIPRMTSCPPLFRSCSCSCSCSFLCLFFVFVTNRLPRTNRDPVLRVRVPLR
jgi:hypothetical protein